MVDQFLTVTGEMNFADRCRRSAGHQPVRGADRRLAGPGRGGQHGRPRQGRPGGLQPGRTRRVPAATACEIDVTVNYYLELTGQATKTSKRHDRRPSWTTRRTRTTASCAGLTADPDQQPRQGGAGGRDEPAEGNWLYFVAIDKQGHSAFAETYAEHASATTQRPCENGVLSGVDLPTRAAVLGKPIAHSLSPVIHNAGYAAAGLTGWSYTRIECAAAELPALVAGLGPEWAGLSVTMPRQGGGARRGRRGLAGRRRRRRGQHAGTPPGRLLVRGQHRRRRHGRRCSPTPGCAAGAAVTVLGAGGTARAALAAAARARRRRR